MPKDWPYGAYVNYIDDRLVDCKFSSLFVTVRDFNVSSGQKRYYGTHYPRLEQLKKKYDPKDVFRFPLSIEE